MFIVLSFVVMRNELFEAQKDSVLRFKFSQQLSGAVWTRAGGHLLALLNAENAEQMRVFDETISTSTLNANI